MNRLGRSFALPAFALYALASLWIVPIHALESASEPACPACPDDEGALLAHCDESGPCPDRGNHHHHREGHRHASCPTCATFAAQLAGDATPFLDEPALRGLAAATAPFHRGGLFARSASTRAPPASPSIHVS